jgi:small subunit ribosomal protein S6
MKYEAMFFVQPNCEEETRAGLITELSSIFEKVNEVEEMGMRKLAYEILKFTSGYYVLLKVEGNGDQVEEFERVCRIREDVIRFMVVRDVEQ